MGLFIFILNLGYKFVMRFNKNPTTLEEQINILKGRGMVIVDEAKASDTLIQINYYRFCGYGLFFENFSNQGDRLDSFKQKTTFDQVYQLYLWDEKIRVLLQETLGWFEITFRSTFVYNMACETKNPFWFIDTSLMSSSFNLNAMKDESKEALERACQSNELVALHYKNAYSESDCLPCWILTELLSFGKWSKLLGFIKNKTHLKIIANSLKAPPDDFVSWIRALVILRNRCAHHGRLWDYQFKIKPSITPALKRLNFKNNRVGVLIWILANLMQINPTRQKNFIDKVNYLIKECPESYNDALGIPRGFSF